MGLSFSISLVNHLLKCLGSMFFYVFLCSSQDVIWLTKDILLSWHIPDVNCFSLDNISPNIMLIHIRSTIEVRYDQPAGRYQFCI
uniref:Putative ovule protein n=1 Tax=Solanum chacoense TaxID=4108 RepID=A0A0V0H772_SOLCH